MDCYASLKRQHYKTTNVTTLDVHFNAHVLKITPILFVSNLNFADPIQQNRKI